ncbi:MAG: polyphosphate polymerase domain-containing protein [Chloroflexota bacterium]
MPNSRTNNLRYELKLTCDNHQLAQARQWIRLHPAGFRRTFENRRVNSLYFDTPNLQSYQGNLSGIAERKKLRLRWYGPISAIVSSPTLELKRKAGLLGDKKQQLLDCTIDWSWPYAEILPVIRAAADKAWHPVLQAAFQPTLINSYTREYFATADGAVRVTLDYDQAAFNQRLSGRPNFGRRLLNQDFVVIEIKGAPDTSDRLEEIMGHFPTQRTRNSKYVNGVSSQLL